MATGKTAASLKVVQVIDSRLTLVLTTKASCETTWPEQIAKHTEGVECLALTDNYGSSKDKARILLDRVRHNTGYLIVVINYETAKLIGDTIALCNFNLVICDECHKLKTHTSKTTKVLAKACKAIPAKLLMTGTAFDDRPTDVYGQVAFLDPYYNRGYLYSNLFGSYSNFFDAYVNYYVSGSIKIPVKNTPTLSTYKNIDKLMKAIDPFTFRMETEDAVDLPPTMFIRRTVKPSKELRKAYDEMAKDMVVHFGDKLAVVDTVLVQSLRLAQMTGGYAIPYHIDVNGDYVSKQSIIEIPNGDCKLQGLLDILDEVGKEPVVVFTRFTEDVNRISHKLRSLGYDVKELTGRLHQHKEFQAGAGDILVANLAAGSTSVTLTRARIVIDYSLGHSRTDYIQSRFRCRRPESDLNKPVVYYQLAVENTIDETILDGLETKGNMVDILRSHLTNSVILT